MSDRACLKALFAAALVAAGACSEPSGPGPVPGGLAVDSTQPANDATDVPFVGPVYAFFDRALDGGTVSASTVGVLLPGGEATPGQVGYDAQRRAIRLDLALIPGVTYQGVVTTAVRGTGGESLTTDFVWSFQTRTPAAGTIDPAPERGGSPVVGLDAAGVAHAAYTDAAAGTVYYARCGGDCTAAGSWATAPVGTGTIAGSRVDLVVSPGGEVAIAWYRSAEGALMVSTCAAGCTAAAAWQAAVVDDAAGDVGFNPSLARGGDGTLHVVAQDRGATAARYARCQSGCDAAANWSAAIQLGGTNVEGRASDVVVSATGTIHAAWADDDLAMMVYAACLSNCTAATSWTVVPMPSTIDAVDRLALTVDPGGRPVVLFGIEGLVAVGLCVSVSCTDDLSWSFLGLLVDALPGTGYSVAADAAGRFHGVYASETGSVRYVTCASLCETSARRWVAGGLTGIVAAVEAALALEPSGDPVAVYRQLGQGVAVVR